MSAPSTFKDISNFVQKWVELTTNKMCAVAVAVLALVSVSVVEGVALDAPSFMSSSSSDNDGPPCSPPDPIENGLASWDGRSKGARYACFQGYHLVGPPRIECRSD